MCVIKPQQGFDTSTSQTELVAYNSRTINQILCRGKINFVLNL